MHIIIEEVQAEGQLMPPTNRREQEEESSAARRSVADAAIDGTPAVLPDRVRRDPGTPYAPRARDSLIPPTRNDSKIFAIATTRTGIHVQRQQNFCYRILAVPYSRVSCVLTKEINSPIILLRKPPLSPQPTRPLKICGAYP